MCERKASFVNREVRYESRSYWLRNGGLNLGQNIRGGGLPLLQFSIKVKGRRAGFPAAPSSVAGSIMARPVSPPISLIFWEFLPDHLPTECLQPWQPHVAGSLGADEQPHWIGVPRSRTITRALLGDLCFQPSTRIARLALEK